MDNVQALTFKGTDLFAGTFYDGIFLSGDKGASWKHVDIGAEHCNVNSIVVSGNNIFAGTAAGVFLSADNGINWTKIEGGLPDEGVYSFAVTGTNIYAAAKRGVYLSTDYGSTWTAFNSGLKGPIGNIAACGNDLFAATEGWIWKYHLLFTPTDESPQGFSLKQNYPNPFNSVTTEYASGVYYCRILTDSFKETKKLLLMK